MSNEGTQGVADIAVPQVQSAPLQDVSQINAVLNNVAAQATQALPSPYTSGTQLAQPSVPTVQPFQPQATNNQPMTNQATSVKSARQKNNFASIGNFIGQTVNQYQEKKNTALKENITKVMQSKQNIANAESVLNMPGIDEETKKRAQNVLDTNKKQLDALFSESKNRKGLQKAFDISYTDPEKNKTPEVAQAIAAKKDFDKAGPLNYNNPNEFAIAKASESLNELDGDAKAAAPARQNELQGGAGNSAYVRPADPAPKSQTPYADAALKKDLPTMENNPQYAAALKQREDAQKQMMVVIPKVIDANAKASLAAAAAGNKVELAKYEGMIKAQAAATKQLDTATNIDANNKAAMARTIQQGSNQVRAIMARAAAIAGVTGNPKIDQAVKDKLGLTALKGLDAEIDASTRARTNLDTQLNATTDEGERAKLTAQLGFNQDILTQLNNTRATAAKQYFPNDVAKQAPTGTVATPETSSLWGTLKDWIGKVPVGMFGIGPQGDGDKNATKPVIEPVGTSESDTSEDSPEDDANNYLPN